MNYDEIHRLSQGLYDKRKDLEYDYCGELQIFQNEASENPLKHLVMYIVVYLSNGGAFTLNHFGILQHERK